MTREVRRIIEHVNDILLSSGLHYTISSLHQCNSKLFLDLHNFLLDSTLCYDPGMKEKEKCQFIVNALEKHLSPVVKLDHIQGSSLASKDQSALINLLNLFLVLWTTVGKSKSCLQASDSVSSLSVSPLSSANDSREAPLHSTPCCVNSHSRACSSATATNFIKSDSYCPRNMCGRHSGQKSLNDYQYEAGNSEMSFSTYKDEDSDDGGDDDRGRDGGDEGDDGDEGDGCGDGDVHDEGDDDYGDILTKLYHGYVEDLNSSSSRREKSRGKNAKLPSAVPGGDLLQLVRKQFPSVYVSPSTLRVLQRKQYQQEALHRHPGLSLPAHVSKKVEQMQQKYKTVQCLLRKDLLHAVNMQQLKLQCEQERGVKKALRSSRMAAAKVKKYYNEYESALRSKLQVPRTKEEQTFIRAFHDSVKYQKEKERERRKYIQGRHALLEQKLGGYLDAMEKCFNDQFSMLPHDALTEVPGQYRQILKSKEIREMEKEIQELQDTILLRRDDVQHFREVDAERFPIIYRR